jgi:galactokinase
MSLLLDCRHLTTETAALPKNVQVVICDTRAKRELTGSEYAERRAQCEEGVRILQGYYPNIIALRDVSPAQLVEHEAGLPKIVAKRCRFIIEENQRVLDLTDALNCGDLAEIGRLTANSYTGARDLYEISCPEMEAMMQAMTGAPGVIGARQAGAGFGGCMVAFVDTPSVAIFAQHVQKEYAAATGLESRVYPVQAAAGAGPIKRSKAA